MNDQPVSNYPSNPIRIAAAMLLIVALPGLAVANTVSFSGTVNSGAVDPLANGDSLTGSIDIADEFLDPGDSFGGLNDSFNVSDDLDAFNFRVGSLNFDLGNSQPFASFNGTVSDDGTTLSDFNVITAFPSFPDCLTCNLNINDAATFNVPIANGLNIGVAEGTLNSTVQAANAVPAPPIILMSGLGLVLIGFDARRRRARG